MGNRKVTILAHKLKKHSKLEIRTATIIYTWFLQISILARPQSSKKKNLTRNIHHQQPKLNNAIRAITIEYGKLKFIKLHKKVSKIDKRTTR